jgi:hypothetical protein
MFHMSNDSDLFRTAQQLRAEGWTRDGRDWLKPNGSGRYVPLYEAKMFDQYNHRYSDYSRRENDRGHRVLPELNLSELTDTTRDPVPFYWVPSEEVRKRIGTATYLIGFGEATTASTERTCVMCAIPPDGVGHKTTIISSPTSAQHRAALLAIGNSLAFDYVVRTKVSYLSTFSSNFRCFLPHPSPALILTSSRDASWS